MKREEEVHTDQWQNS